MATIGEMLRMDEDGRFVIGGKGVAITDELSRRERESVGEIRAVTEETQSLLSEDDQVILRDSSGLICGYFEMRQVLAMPEATSREGNALQLMQKPTSARRLEMLRESLKNPDITDDQRTEVESEVATILAARLKGPWEPYKGETDTQRKNPSTSYAQPSKVSTYIVRDGNGLFLGIMTYVEAQKRWPTLRLKKGVISTGSIVGFETAKETSQRPLPRIKGGSSKVVSALAKARLFTLKPKKCKAYKYWSGQKNIAYAVHYKFKKPLCIVPYECIWKGFGDSWIVTGENSVQLVGNWIDGDAERCAERARRTAKRNYVAVSRIGQLCVSVAEYEKMLDRSKKMSAHRSKPTEARTTVGVEPMIRDAKPKKQYNPTPLAPELTQEERRRIWSPPERDTSRFSGTNASRHRAFASQKDPSEYDTYNSEGCD